jgi:hypothetical protein
MCVVGDLNYLVFDAWADHVEVAHFMRCKGGEVLGFRPARMEAEKIEQQRTRLMHEGRGKIVALAESVLTDFDTTLEHAQEAKKRGADEVHLVTTRRRLTSAQFCRLERSAVTIMFLASELEDGRHHYKFCCLEHI